MSNTSKPADSFRAATQIRSLKGSNDNSFRKATNLGTISPGRSFSFKAKNSVGLNDTVDYYKFKVFPGVDIFSSLQISTKKSGIKLTVYSQFGSGNIGQDASLTILPGSPLSGDDTTFNSTNTTATIYLKFTPLKGSNSDYTINYFSNF